MCRTLLIASPRGFCAGVRRAVNTVDEVLKRADGRGVYVFNEIVHNTFVVETFRKRGVKFVTDVASVPPQSILIFSAHGVSQSVEAEALARGCTIVDATCPLVAALHARAINLAQRGSSIVMIGHPRHPETIGTLGRLPVGANFAVTNSTAGVAELPELPPPVAALVQTTLSPGAIEPVFSKLRERFAGIELAGGCCYATENRQKAVALIAGECDAVVIVGSPHSSNSRELRKVAEKCGVRALQAENAESPDLEALAGVATLGLSAGASAPPELVKQVTDKLIAAGFADVRELAVAEEEMAFALPAALKKL